MAKGKNGKGNGKKKNGNGNKAMEKRKETLPAVKGALDGIPAGFENVDRDDIILGRLAIVQPSAKCIDPSDENAPSEGDIINTATLEIFEQPVEVVPIFMNKSAILWGEEIGDPFRCRSRDSKWGVIHGECAKCEYYWKEFKNDIPPECTLLYEFVSVLATTENPSEALPLIVSMSRSSARIAKTWLSGMRSLNRNMFSHSYKLSAEQAKSDKGRFYIFNVQKGIEVDEELYHPVYQMIYQDYKEGRVVSDIESAEDNIAGDDDLPF